MPTKPLTIRMDSELRAALEREARAEERSAAQLVNRAVRDMLTAKAEKRQAIAAAIAEADQGAFISEQALNAWMDAWDGDEEPPLPEPDILPGQA